MSGDDPMEVDKSGAEAPAEQRDEAAAADEPMPDAPPAAADDADAMDEGNDDDVPLSQEQNAKIVEKGRAKIRKEKLKQLEELRSQHRATVAEAKSKSVRDRLAFLHQQTDIFAHFVSNASSPVKKRATSKTGASKRRGLSEADEDQALIEQELDTERRNTRLTVQPKCITGKMRPYQLDGLNWLISLYENGINGILADEMGLGKTLQSISIMGYLKEYEGISGPHIVVVPKSTLPNWMNELRRWCPSLRPIKLHGDQEERARAIREDMIPGEFDVLVTSYEIAIIEKAALRKLSWRYIIVDEAHRIKNVDSRLSELVRSLDSQCRLLITGTPLQNNLKELWALLNFLLPDIFGSWDDFRSWFSISEDDGGEAVDEDVAKQLHKVLRPFLLRRLKTDVEHSLPPKKETILAIGLTELQRSLYVKILERNLDIINPSTGKRSGERLKLLNVVMQLRKVCNHPYLFDNVEPGPPYTNGQHIVDASGKLILLDKLLPRLKQNGSRVLVFSQMTRMLDILEDYFLMREYEYCRIDGQTGVEDRQNQIDDYNQEGSSKFVFLLSTRAGGLGINLATADVVILFDSDWNPQADLQAQDRAHRIGQKKPVSVYRFASSGTIEEQIIKRARKKLNLDSMVIQQGRFIENRNLKTDDLSAMVRYGASDMIHQENASFTDDDIDEILARGNALTEEMVQQEKSLMDKLLDFSSEKNVYEYDGVDYKDSQQKLEGTSKVLANWVHLKKRERKQSYDENAYYREMMRPAGGSKSSAPARPPKMPVAYDHQFFDKRVYDLNKRETLLWLIKTDRIKVAEGEDPPERPDELTDDEVALRAELMDKTGFRDWSKREFHQFIRGSEMHGRSNYRQIAKQVPTKTLEEVKEYGDVFWKRLKEIDEWEKHLKVVERGEARIEKYKHITEALRHKVEHCSDDPLLALQIPYGQTKGKLFTEDEDRFLVVQTHELGVGNIDALKEAIRDSWQFRFDWFLKSRSPLELSRRVDTLCRLIEKEYQEQRGAKRGAPANGGRGRKKQKA